MRHDEIAAVIDAVTRWAEESSRRSVPDADGLGVVLEALSDDLGVTDLGDLTEGTATELLLDHCPGRVGTDRIDAVLDAARAVVEYAADTGLVPATLGAKLRREIDAAADEFGDAVLAEEVAGAFHDLLGTESEGREADGAAGPGEAGDSDGTERDEDADEVADLVAVFGTDRLPPLRLPPEDQLADEARASPRLARVLALARWVGPGRPVTAEGDPEPADAVAAVDELALGDPDLAPDSEARLTELAQLWELAEALGFVDVEDTGAVAGEVADEWADGDDDTVLLIWRQALTEMSAWSMLTDAERAAEIDLDLRPAGSTLLPLFAARRDGLPLARVSGMIRQMAVDDLPSGRADEAWGDWVAVHGDPARVLYTRLADLGAVDIDEVDVVRLRPLGLYALWTELSDDLEIPLLPPPEEMHAEHLLAVGTTGTDDDLRDEWQGWRTVRDADTAARALADAARDTGPDERLIATSLLRELGEDADAVWRELLDEPALRPYAKQALTDLHGPAPEFEQDDEDLAWLLLDLYCAVDEEDLPDDLAGNLAEAVRPGEESVFDTMWRLDHPHRHTVLTLIGRHHPDTDVAKAARKASFKAPNS